MKKKSFKQPQVFLTFFFYFTGNEELSAKNVDCKKR